MTQKPGPDIEALTIAYLLTDTATAAIFGTRIRGELDRTKAATLPALVITRPSTIPAVQRHLDGALIQFDAWADTKAKAFDGAAAARAALLNDEDFAGLHVGFGVVTGTEDVGGLRWFPDPELGTPRYFGTVRVYAHPAPA